MQKDAVKVGPIPTIRSTIAARIGWYRMSFFQRNKDGLRRLSPSRHKLSLTTHIVVSGAWLGATLAKFFLSLGAVTTTDSSLSAALLAAIHPLTIPFQVLTFATALSGVLLALGTKWGFISYYWILVKIALSVTIVLTASVLTEGFLSGLNSAVAQQVFSNGTLLKIASTGSILLLSLCLFDLLLLVVVTGVSVYKPWGKTRFGERRALAGKKA